MIRRLLPEFIESKFLDGKQTGKLSGSIISIDIKGFTPLTDELMNQGSQGIEILSEILNQVFSPIINLVYSNGGWVTHFAGDALSAFFKGIKSDDVVEVIDFIREEFELHNDIKTAVGNFKLDIRIGLASGIINWGIVNCEPYNLFYFKGSPLDQSTLYTFSRKKYHSKNLPSRISTLLNVPIRKTRVKTLKDFFPGAILKIKSSGEFREIVSVFISFKSQQINFKQFVKRLSKLTEKYKGYLNKIAFGNKGGVALIIFGAPVAIENAVAHALNLASELQHSFHGLKISVTKGRAFAGFMGSSLRSEYTCIGKTVNLSARFLEKAKPGTTLVDKNIFESGSSEFYFTGLGRIPIRGFKGKVPLYLLNGKKKKLKEFFQGTMIGREAELKKMHKYTDLISQGEFGGIIYIEGEGGIGKSRLLERFKTNLRSENFNWFYLPCDEIVRESFNPFIYFLKSYFNQDDDVNNLQNKNNFEKQFKFLISNCPDKEIVSELKRTKSILSQLINLQVKDSLYDKLDSKGKYENLIFAIKNLIKAVSLLKPTIIELDDSHWIDPDSINLIKVLINNVQGFPFLIISEFRRYESDKIFNDLFINTTSMTINLKRFTLSLTRALIEDRLKEKVTDNLVRIILEKSEGIPFYIEQLISYLDETGALIKVKKRIGLSLEKINIPGEISSIIIARVDKLRYHLRDLIKNASVLGKEFSVRVLSKMLKGRVIEKNLKDVESEAIWSPLNELTYIFKSALIRDAVYEMQLKKTLKNLHQLAAAAIERTYKKKLKPHFGELAFHFEKSANTKKAKEYLLKAGDQAKKAFRNSEALEYYNKLNKYLKVPQDRIENIIKIGIMEEFLGVWDKSEKHYREALRRSITVNDQEMIARSKNSLGNLVGVRGSFYDALELIKDANKIFKKLKHKRGIVNTYGNLGVINKNLGNIKKAFKYFNLQLKMGHELKNKKQIAGALGSLGILYSESGEYRLALEYFNKELKILKTMKSEYRQLTTIGNMGTVYLSLGDYKKAKEYILKYLTFSEKYGDKNSIGQAFGNLGIIYKHQGDNQKAFECYNKLLQIALELGDKHGQNVAIGNLGNYYETIGDNRKAMEYYQKKLVIASELGDKKSISHAIGSMGSIYENLGDYVNAMKSYKELLKISEELGDKRSKSVAICNMGAVYWNEGRLKKARDFLERFLDISIEIGDKFNMSIAYGNLGDLNRGLKQYSKAEVYYNKAITIAKELNLKYLLCSYLYEKAVVLYEERKFHDAEKLNAEAFDLAKDVSRYDVLFSSRILSAKLIAVSDSKTARTLLEKQLQGTKDSLNIAELNYELFIISGLKKFQKKALSLYKRIYKSTPNFEYKNRITVLVK